MFDLEKEIVQWRKSLNGNEALEDGYKEELENHLRDKIDYLIVKGSKEENAFLQAVELIGNVDTIGTEFYKAHTRHLNGTPPWKQNRWMPSLISNYFKIGLRKIKRQKIFSLINITGLAVGLACCAVIILYVSNELSYDSYHKDVDRIYRIGSHTINQVGEAWRATTPGPLRAELKSSYPQVEEAIRVIPPFENSNNVLVVREEKRFFENRLFFVDPEIFRFFHIPLIQGSPKTALLKPNQVVITEEMAEKYFGNEDPFGKTLQIEIDYDTGTVEIQDYEVTGVIRNAPANTHFKYDMLLSIATISSNFPPFEQDWVHWHGKYTYVKLRPETDVALFEEKIQTEAQVAAKKYEDRFDRKLPLSEFFLQPVTKIHMRSDISMELETPGNWYYLYIYSIVAFLILLIGCMNFINLSASLSIGRTREVGLRKVVGAARFQLIWQFLGESFLITSLAFVAAIGLIGILLVPFNQMAGTELSLAGLTQPVVLFSLLGLLFCVSIGSGAYPAFFLTSLKPVSILQNKTTPTSPNSWMQKFLVVGQFAISIFLVICTLTVFNQLNFMKGRALGFDLQQKLILRVKSNMRHLRTDYEEIKNDFMGHPSITGATVSSSVPGDIGDSGYYLTTRPGDYQNAPRLKVITIDYDFIELYGIQMVAGRSLDPKMGNDDSGAYLINMAGLEELNFASPEEALGKSFQASYHRKTKRIVGITDNFHFTGMREVVEPYIMDIEPSLMSTITLSVKIENMGEIMRFVKDKWNAHFPGVPFDYFFLDDNFDRVYRYEEQMSRMLGIITTLGFIIACLGLFGLTAFIVHNRKKEIGIRKILGASSTDIVTLLSKNFVLLIVAAIIIACPAALISMNLWLQDFAYRVDLKAIVFLVSAFGALIIALATVSLQGLRAAAANPTNSLRDE
ncbi:ABC transporter permease [Acidobacteriota bacterium]